jgi:hypothetical protein
MWRKLASYLHWRIKYKQNLCVRIVVWPKKLVRPCILAHVFMTEKYYSTGHRYGAHNGGQRNQATSVVGAAIATWRDQLELV